MNLTEQAAQYHEQLLSTQRYGELLARGLTHSTIDRFQLGFIRHPLTETARTHIGAYTIPYINALGTVHYLKMRRSTKPKYLKLGRDYPLPEPKFHLFNAMAGMPTTHSSTVFIVEGEFDAMIMVQCGLKAVAVPGANQWHEPWCHIFSEADVRIAFDGDTAGRKGALQLAQTFQRYRISTTVVPLPDGTDITDIYLDGGRDRLYELLTK